MGRVRELLIEARGPRSEGFGVDNDLSTKVEVSKGLLQAAIRTILTLEMKVAELETKSVKDSWRDNPDRMGGSFSNWEVNRRGDEWS